MGVNTRRLERLNPSADKRNPNWYFSIDVADLHGWRYANAATDAAADTDTTMK